MARHDQRPFRSLMQCPACKRGDCNECVDVTRFLLGKKTALCTCRRQGHDGEPRDKQVEDPTSPGTIIGPGMVLHPDGAVDIHRLPLPGEVADG